MELKSFGQTKCQPMLEKRPQCYVVNTDTCGMSRQHLTTFFFPEGDEPFEFFDSLGQTPEHDHARFKKVLMANGPQYRYVKSRLQSLDSDICR